MKNRIIDRNKIVIKERKYNGSCGIYQKKCGCCKSLDHNSLPKKSIFPENRWESCNDKVSTWTIVGMIGTFILILLFVLGRALFYS